MKSTITLLAFVVLMSFVGCRTGVDAETEKDLAKPVVPEGFNEKNLHTLKCPENRSKLRFATKRELAHINDRIGGLKMKTWFDGSIQKDLVSAVLIREDGKIAYRVDGIVPILRIEDALVLNDKIGRPDPKKNSKEK